MDIGDKVKVKGQCITGEIIRYDCGNKVVILEDDCEWAEEGEEGTLIFSKDDLELIDTICDCCGSINSMELKHNNCGKGFYVCKECEA